MLRLLIPLAALVLVIAACGDAADPTVPTDPTDPTDIATTVAPAPDATTPPTTAPPSTAGAGDADPDAPVAADGDTVAVHYTGTLDDGSEFDSSEGRDPLTFVVGSGQVISGFDEAVRGLAVGESRTVRIEPENAYGEVDPALVLEFPIDQAPEGVQAGDQLTLSNGQRVEVVEVTDEIVRVDANHRLAGQALTFEVELVSLN